MLAFGNITLMENSASQVFRCLTDNGSEMVKASKILQHDENAENPNSKQTQPDTEDLVDADNESNDSYDDSEDVANFEEASVIATDEIQQFEEHEEEHGTALATWRRSSCFKNSLHLVVRITKGTIL